MITIAKQEPAKTLVTPASRNLTSSSLESGSRKTKQRGTICKKLVSIVNLSNPSKLPPASVSFETSQIIVIALPIAHATVHARFPIVVKRA